MDVLEAEFLELRLDPSLHQFVVLGPRDSPPQQVAFIAVLQREGDDGLVEILQTIALQTAVRRLARRERHADVTRIEVVRVFPHRGLLRLPLLRDERHTEYRNAENRRSRYEWSMHLKPPEAISS